LLEAEFIDVLAFGPDIGEPAPDLIADCLWGEGGGFRGVREEEVFVGRGLVRAVV